MKRHIPGLHSRQHDGDAPLEGLFLVRVEWASYRWHPQKPFLRFALLSWNLSRFEQPLLLRPALLHRTSPLEAQLVPARLRL